MRLTEKFVMLALAWFMVHEVCEWFGMMVCCVSSREVIAVNQDQLGVQGRLVKSSAWLGNDGKVQDAANRVYSRPLSNHSVAVALLNTHSFSYPHNITFTFKDVRNSTED